MGRKDKTEGQVPEQEPIEQEIPGQEPPEQEPIGQERPEQEPEEKNPLEYVVIAAHGLNLRQRPSPNAPIITVLPCGVGVYTGLVQNGWMEVSTGKLAGWVKAEYLEPLWA